MGTVELTLPGGGRSPEGLRVGFRFTVASTRDVPACAGGNMYNMRDTWSGEGWEGWFPYSALCLGCRLRGSLPVVVAATIAEVHGINKFFIT